MNQKNGNKSISFLRGVPAEEALVRLAPDIAEGYRKAVEKYGVQVLQYGHFRGFEPLRKLIGNTHDVPTERVVVGNGGLEMLSLFFKSLPGRSKILVEETSYDRVLMDIANYGHRSTGVGLSKEGLDLDRLNSLAKKGSYAAFYGIPFHHNPSGVTYTEDNRQAVEKICRENNIMCIWDVCYQRLRYDGNTNVNVKISEWGPIIAGSFTKTIAPGTKCGYIVVPKNRVEHLTQIVANTRINPNLPTQALVCEFMESGRFEDFLGYLKRLYKPRMDALNAALETYFPGAYPARISGGFFSTLSIPGIGPAEECSFIRRARDAGVGIAPAWNAVAPNLLQKKRKRGFFTRLTFPAFEPERIESGIAKLARIVDPSQIYFS